MVLCTSEPSSLIDVCRRLLMRILKKKRHTGNLCYFNFEGSNFERVFYFYLYFFKAHRKEMSMSILKFLHLVSLAVLFASSLP